MDLKAWGYSAAGALVLSYPSAITWIFSPNQRVIPLSIIMLLLFSSFFPFFFFFFFSFCSFVFFFFFGGGGVGKERL